MKQENKKRKSSCIPRRGERPKAEGYSDGKKKKNNLKVNAF